MSVVATQATEKQILIPGVEPHQLQKIGFRVRTLIYIKDHIGIHKEIEKLNYLDRIALSVLKFEDNKTLWELASRHLNLTTSQELSAKKRRNQQLMQEHNNSIKSLRFIEELLSVAKQGQILDFPD